MGERLPISRIVTQLAEEDPTAPAVTCSGETVTRGELDRGTNRLARAYERLGVEQGDFVTIALPNSIEFYLATVAVWKLGAVPQPISFRLPDREREAIVDLADPALVVGVEPEAHPGRPSIPLGYEAADDLDDGPLDERVSPAWKAPTSGGSTGRPKLIVAGQPGAMRRDEGRHFFMRPDDRQLVPGPLYHNAPFAMSMLGLFMGQHIVVLRRFDAEVALREIGGRRITWMTAVPTMLLRMLRVLQERPDEFDLSSLRYLWHMAAPCAPWLKEAWIELLGPDRLMELYGGTESQSMTVISGREWLEHRGSVGKPAYGEIVILDEFGAPLPPGEVGEVFMRPARSRATYRYVGAEARTHDGWESLGDLGWTDEDGYLYLSDRRTDMIVTGGANVYPAEVEAAIEEHPAVRSCAVVGLPDDDLGQCVHAVVDAAPGTSPEDILRHLADRLVRYKIPRSVEIVDTLLRDDGGKVRRSAVQTEVIRRLGAGGSASLPSGVR